MALPSPALPSPAGAPGLGWPHIAFSSPTPPCTCVRGGPWPVWPPGLLLSLPLSLAALAVALSFRGGSGALFPGPPPAPSHTSPGRSPLACLLQGGGTFCNHWAPPAHLLRPLALTCSRHLKLLDPRAVRCSGHSKAINQEPWRGRVCVEWAEASGGAGRWPGGPRRAQEATVGMLGRCPEWGSRVLLRCPLVAALGPCTLTQGPACLFSKTQAGALLWAGWPC